MNLGDGVRKLDSLAPRPCPNNRDDHTILEPDDTTRASLELAQGSLLHVDRTRRPRNGDLVWAEVVLGGSRRRLVRRYHESDGFVTLSVLAGAESPIMRPSYAVMVLGVAEPHRM